MTVPIYNLTDTWNNAVTVFTAIKMGVTNTASAAGSKLLDLAVGGVSKFNVKVTGETVTTGLDITATNPEAIGGAGFWQTAVINTTWSDITGLNPNFANLEMLAVTSRIWHADVTYSSGGQTQAKTTQLPITINSEYNAGAQRFLLSRIGNFYGMGDAFVNTTRIRYGGGPLPGDEGFGMSSVGGIFQPLVLTLDTVGSVTRASGNTTVTQAIVANKDPQVVTVASTAGMVVGDWYQVGRVPPAASFNTEAIQVLAIGVGTITALFRVNQNISATLTPALVLGLSQYSEMGQLRVLVNLSGASYSTGTITGKSGAALLASGTAFTANMVGGDANNIGAISLDDDTYSGSPFNSTGVNGPLRAWYEISSVNLTDLAIVSYTIAGDVSYRSSRWNPPSNYIIRPAVRILRNLGNGSLVCETTSTTWSVGHSVEQAICPYPDCIGDGQHYAAFTPGATMRSMFGLTNSGPVPFDVGLGVSGAVGDQAYGLNTGISLANANTGILFEGTVSADIDFATTSVGKIKFSDSANNPYIKKSGGGSIDFVYGGQTGAFGGMFCSPIAAPHNVATAEFRSSRIGISGSPAGDSPYLRLSLVPGDFAAAATAIDIKLATSTISASGFRGLEFRVYDVPTFSLTDYSAGTNSFFQCKSAALTLANGANGTKTIAKSFQRIDGPTGAFSLAGFQISTSIGDISQGGLDGGILYLYNSTAQAMTLLNNAGGQPTDILTLTGANVVFTGPSMATLIYNVADNRWILMSTYH